MEPFWSAWFRCLFECVSAGLLACSCSVRWQRACVMSIFSQAQIQATDELMLEQEYTTGPIESWLISFVQWAENSTDYRYRRFRLCSGLKLFSRCLFEFLSPLTRCVCVSLCSTTLSHSSFARGLLDHRDCLRHACACILQRECGHVRRLPGLRRPGHLLHRSVGVH